MKLNIRALAFTAGLLWGFGVFFLTWWLLWWHPELAGQPSFVGLVYPGYTVSAVGSVIGFLWGFVDMFIGGLIFAWLYNFFAGVKKTTVA
jgi:hypothetical protein